MISETQTEKITASAPSSDTPPFPGIDLLTDNEYYQLFAEAVPDVTHQLYILGAGIFVVILIIFLIKVAIRKRKQKKVIREATNYVLLQISQTKHTDEQKDELKEVHKFEDLLHSIILEKKPIIFEMAIANEDTDIVFLLAIPPEHVETARNQVRRVFPRSEVQEIRDYTIFEKDGHSIMANASLKQFYGLPIHSYKKAERDTFASIVGAFANAKEGGTGATMQLTLRKAPKRMSGSIRSTVKQMKDGTKLNHIHPVTTTDSIMKTINAFSFLSSSKDKDSEKKEKEPNQEIQKIEEKMQNILFLTNVRIGVCSANEEKTERLFDNIKDQFDQFGPPGNNNFLFARRKDKKINLDFTFRLMNHDTDIVLTAEEVSSIFHILDQNIEVSNLQWEKTKHIAAPTKIGREGLLLGDNIFHGQQTPVYIPDGDRLRHFYIIGQTGTGKTATIKSMVYQDIQNGKGACVIDPHGDLVDDMLATIPEHRLDDVIIFDPSNIKNPLIINMLEYDRNKPEEKTFIVDEILSIFQSLFSTETMGPMFDHYLRNSLLLLMDGKQGEPATLLDVPRVFTNDAFREELLNNCSIETTKRFWQEEAEKVEGEASLSNIAPYITSKFGNFISNDYIRPIISKPYSSFSFREVMDNGKLLFVKLSQGKIGKINAGLMGMIVTGKIALAAFSRDDTPEHQRRDFYLYIDEFQNFTTDSISKILSEARKYHLSLTVGHQYMAQLTDDIRGAVLGNVGNTITFRVGIEDAEVLEKKFAPALSAAELAEIENLNCAVSMLSNNAPLPPFTMKVRFAPRGSDEAREKVIRYVSLNYSKDNQTETDSFDAPATHTQPQQRQSRANRLPEDLSEMDKPPKYPPRADELSEDLSEIDELPEDLLDMDRPRASRPPRHPPRTDRPERPPETDRPPWNPPGTDRSRADRHPEYPPRTDSPDRPPETDRPPEHPPRTDRPPRHPPRVDDIPEDL